MRNEDISRIAVIGAGTMGTDVALNLACYGYEVQLMDRATESLEMAFDAMSKSLRMARMMRPELRDVVETAVFDRITLTSSMDQFDTCGLVIENVTEKFEIKSSVYQQLRDHCNEETLFCANTSCISITKIGALLKDPGKAVGMHFMNPVLLKDTVEVIKGYHTSEETLATAKSFLKSIKKMGVVVNDFPGFVANRVSHLFMNEAAFLVQDQVADPAAVDLIFKRGYGHPMGPLETADLIGLDTVADSLEILYTNYQDSKFRCCPLLKKMVDAGLLGKKSGQGFYKY